MNARFFITVILITVLSILNAFLIARGRAEGAKKWISMLGVIFLAIVIGRWDLTAIIVAIVVWFGIWFLYLMLDEPPLILFSIGASIIAALVFLLGIVCGEEEISRRVVSSEKTQIIEFVDTDVDKSNLYYVYYVKTDSGAKAQKVLEKETEVVYEEGEAYIEEKYVEITYSNSHFCYVEKATNQFGGYVIHIPKGGLIN